MTSGNLVLSILAVSILLQVASAAMALCLMRRSGFHLPWLLISIAVTLMAIRRITSVVGMIQRGEFPASALGPELIALVISVLMLTGLWLFRPAFRSLTAARKQELSAKDLLIRESHHHVKNDLQMLQSLIRLQMNTTQESGERDILRDLMLRVRAFSVLHEHIYRGVEREVSFRQYIGNLAQAIAENFQPVGVRLQIDLHDVSIDWRNLLYSGLVVNEALTNAYKYAFEEGAESPVIRVSNLLEGDEVVVEITDNGKGLPPEVLEGSQDSYGFTLMRGIGSYPGWSLDIESPPPGLEGAAGPERRGTRVLFRFPAGTPEPRKAFC
ncbi:MAG: sensor histidine kinase [Spirochaetaceae bacterium]